jgi:four helix bundle protein
MEKKIRSYQDLSVWQKSVQLVTDIYSLTKQFAAEERFGIISQLNRAAISIPTNVAEGWGREMSKNYIQFLRIARGSVMEVHTLLIISRNLNFMSEDESKSYVAKTEEAGKTLQGLIRSIREKNNFN